jgi:hypothetical protein
MKNFRRILLTSAAALGIASVASATTITGTAGTPSCTDNGTITTCKVTVSGSTTGNFQVGEPTTDYPNATPELLQLSNFGSLGITGTYVGAVLDFQFGNAVTNIAIKNNDAGTDQATITINSLASLDSATTGLNSTDLLNVVSVAEGLGFTTSTRNATAFQYGLNKLVYTSGNQVIFAGNTFNGTNSSFTDNLSAGTSSTGSDFNTFPITLTTDLSGAGSFVIGTNDILSYNVANNGGTGALNLGVQYNSSYNTAAAVTYTYTVTDPPSTAPEPATFALFGGALLGAGLLRKRIVR